VWVAEAMGGLKVCLRWAAASKTFEFGPIEGHGWIIRRVSLLLLLLLLLVVIVE